MSIRLDTVRASSRETEKAGVIWFKEVANVRVHEKTQSFPRLDYLEHSRGHGLTRVPLWAEGSEVADSLAEVGSIRDGRGPEVCQPPARDNQNPRGV